MTQSILNSSKCGTFYKSPKDANFIRNVGDYPPKDANLTLLGDSRGIQQPPMCTGKALKPSGDAPVVRARQTDKPSVYST